MSEPGSNSNLKTAIGGGVALALLASNIYLFVQLHDVKADAVKDRSDLIAQIQDLKENTSSIASTSRKHFESLNEDLDRRQRLAMQATNSVKNEALSKIEQEKKELQAAQEQSAKKLSGDVDAVKEAANAKIAEVSTDVGTVKTQVSDTRSTLEKTIGDLKRVQGDLGVTSGYVATNGKELAALKRLGERNYIEFTLPKSKQPQKVGDISLLLKKTDAKKNKFSVDVMADDKHYEKKDKTANEPVQFYVAKAKQPYEIVVNSVGKDQIIGYLSTPKDMIPR